MDAKRIPNRDEIPEAYTWDLTHIFPDDEAWMAEYESLKTVPAELAAYQGHLGDSAQKLLDFLRYSDDISVRVELLYGYASCKKDQDLAQSAGQDLYSKASSTAVAVSSAAAFSTPELVALAEDKLNQFYRECPDLEIYRRPLTCIRRRKDHVLSAPEEALLSAAGEMARAPGTINSVFQEADLKFPDVTDSEGVSHPLSAVTLVPLLQSPDRAFRKDVFHAYYTRLGEFQHTVAAALDAQFKKLFFYSTARKYPGTLEASLDANEIPVPVYTSLIEAVHENLDKMYAYVDLRKKLMGLDELHMYDIYPPILEGCDRQIPYEEAKEKVLAALSVLGTDYTDLLSEGFDSRWIDVYPNVGKRSGAYSSGSARPHPYVLLNQKDTLDCMFTIAHEMGHALHSWHSTNHQPVCTSDYVIFVAEVASTCNEILLMRYLLAHTEDPREKAYLINHFLDQFKGTIYRQTMFAEFELWMGRAAEAGSALTADSLNEKYLELNKLYYGPGMVSDEEIALEWARIPHFFYNYYVYQYATGFSAAVAIANRILSEGAPAVEDYKKFLSSGSSADPISLLKIAGVDMSTPAPVNSALSLFGELIGEMDSLTQSGKIG